MASYIPTPLDEEHGISQEFVAGTLCFELTSECSNCIATTRIGTHVGTAGGGWGGAPPPGFDPNPPFRELKSQGGFELPQAVELKHCD